MENAFLPPRKIAVRVITDDHRNDGFVEVREWTKAAKTKRAFALLAICWAIAAISFPLAYIDFFTTPAFVVLGLYLFTRVEGWIGRLTGLEASCPHCGQALALAAKPKEESLRWPIEMICQNCHVPVTIRPSLRPNVNLPAQPGARSA